MNLLVPGGLFVVALLAIGGAFWMALGERQSNRAAQSVATDTIVPPSSSGEQGEPAMSAEQTSTSTEEEQDQFVSAPTRQLEDIESAGHSFSMFNGQFYELAAELRALHRESQDIERRLEALSALVNRIESEYGEVGVEVE